jgi:hypothetical protein
MYEQHIDKDNLFTNPPSCIYPTHLKRLVDIILTGHLHDTEQLLGGVKSADIHRLSATMTWVQVPTCT